MKRSKSKRIVRTITLNPEVGAAALFAGSCVEGLPLKSMKRNESGKVTLVYSK